MKQPTVQGVKHAIPGELLVEFLADLTRTDKEEILGPVEGHIICEGIPFDLVGVPTGTEEEAIAELSEKEGVIKVLAHEKISAREPHSGPGRRGNLIKKKTS